MPSVILNAIKSESFLVKLGVGCSIGLARLSPEQQPRDLFHLADEALYQAKSSGKGKVRHSSYRSNLAEKLTQPMRVAS
ncbi:diguanylate cyclase domain-containing protein [Alishewanella longhuensis]